VDLTIGLPAQPCDPAPAGTSHSIFAEARHLVPACEQAAAASDKTVSPRDDASRPRQPVPIQRVGSYTSRRVSVSSIPSGPATRTRIRTFGLPGQPGESGKGQAGEPRKGQAEEPRKSQVEEPRKSQTGTGALGRRQGTPRARSRRGRQPQTSGKPTSSGSCRRPLATPALERPTTPMTTTQRLTNATVKSLSRSPCQRGRHATWPALAAVPAIEVPVSFSEEARTRTRTSWSPLPGCDGSSRHSRYG
jgi:hypothetical protein